MKKYYIKLPSRNALKSYIRLKIRRTHLWLKADTPTLLMKSS